MAITSVSPSPTATPKNQVGQGSTIVFTCGSAVTVGDVMYAELGINGTTFSREVCIASRAATSTSSIQTVQFGVSPVIAPFDGMGGAQQITLDLKISHLSALLSTIETTTFTAAYLYDGISNLWLLPSTDSATLLLILARVTNDLPSLP